MSHSPSVMQTAITLSLSGPMDPTETGISITLCFSRPSLEKLKLYQIHPNMLQWPKQENRPMGFCFFLTAQMEIPPRLYLLRNSDQYTKYRIQVTPFNTTLNHRVSIKMDAAVGKSGSLYSALIVNFHTKRVTIL